MGYYKIEITPYGICHLYRYDRKYVGRFFSFQEVKNYLINFFKKSEEIDVYDWFWNKVDVWDNGEAKEK